MWNPFRSKLGAGIVGGFVRAEGSFSPRDFGSVAFYVFSFGEGVSSVSLSYLDNILHVYGYLNQRRNGHVNL